ncbi:hypothetical protein BJ322DRAFT_1092260 [Thelephora terrestris]|uniref:Uncharacterized protein n=1 Tax=Thelephora terrestris TaxID=56493 RepID=A0A9P6H3L1_9AGAM|nr:hypothetical protein BJ322DRAFT_1092260 [Thelephora terrestris]
MIQKYTKGCPNLSKACSSQNQSCFRSRSFGNFSCIFLLMILSNSTSNAPSQTEVSSNIVGVLCGALFCFLLLTTTFLCWRTLGDLVRRLKERTTTQSAPQSTRPAVNSPSAPPLALPATALTRRLHGPDSVDTLPPYTPSEGPSPSKERNHAATA